MACHICKCVPFVQKNDKPIVVLGQEWCVNCWNEFQQETDEIAIYDRPSDEELDKFLKDLAERDAQEHAEVSAEELIPPEEM